MSVRRMPVSSAAEMIAAIVASAEPGVCCRAMQVMEFGDGRIARRQHFGIDLRGDYSEHVRVDHACQAIHLLTPGPEIILAGR